MIAQKIIEALLILVFVVPIIAACVFFALAALWIQVQEEGKDNGKGETAKLHA